MSDQHPDTGGDTMNDTLPTGNSGYPRPTDAAEISDKSSRNLAERLLNAPSIQNYPDNDTTNGVEDILKEIEDEHNVKWKALGGGGSWTAVHSSQGSQMGALVEIIVNGFDAVLLRRYRERFDCSEYRPEANDHEELDTYNKAARKLFSEEERSLRPEPDNPFVELWTDGGGRSYPGGGGSRDPQGTNFVVADRGEGKKHDNFEDTFLGLLKPGKAKQEWPFTQGQFGVGSSASLAHCGKGHKFIASASSDEQEIWTWTITRKNVDEREFEYLTIDGKLPTFNGRFAERSCGTVIKLFEYYRTFPQPHSQGAHKIGRTLYETPLPMRLQERRDYESSMESVMWDGHKRRLEENADSRGLLETEFSGEFDFGETEIDGEKVEIGKMPYHGYVLRSDEDLQQEKIEEIAQEVEGISADMSISEVKAYNDGEYRKRIENRKQRKTDYLGTASEHDERAVMFTVNGQVHGDFREQALTGNRTNLKHVGEDTLIYIDFSEFAHENATLVDVFQANRSFLNRDMEVGKQVYSGTYELLGDPDELKTLHDINEQRKRARRKHEHQEREMVRMNSVLEANPYLTRYFGEFGQMMRTEIEAAPGEADGGTKKKEDKTSTPWTRPPTEEHIDQKDIPDELIAIKKVEKNGKIVPWENESSLVKEVSVNSHGWVKFKLNAVDDYLSRDEQGGDLKPVPEGLVSGYEFANGVLRLKVNPFQNASPGDENTLTVNVTRPRSDDLTETIKVRCVEPTEPREHEKKDVPDSDESGTSSLVNAVGQPNIKKVTKEEWTEYNPPFSEETIVDIDGDDPRDFEYRVNIDAAPIADFRERRNIHKEGAEVVNEEWSAIIFLMALGTYMRWARAIHERMVELEGHGFLDEDLITSDPEDEMEEEEDNLLPDRTYVDRVVEQFDYETLEGLDVTELAAASVSGNVQAIMDWRYADDDDLEGLAD